MKVVLHVLIIKDSGLFWKSIYDLAAVFLGSKEFMYFCVILTSCLVMVREIFRHYYCLLLTCLFAEVWLYFSINIKTESI